MFIHSHFDLTLELCVDTMAGNKLLPTISERSETAMLHIEVCILRRRTFWRDNFGGITDAIHPVDQKWQVSGNTVETETC